MIKKDTQETIMGSGIHFNIYHVFMSSVRFDMYISTALGMLIYDTSSYTWVESGIKNREELLEKFKDYPVYSHGEVVDNLTFWKRETVKSLTDVSYADL